MAGDGNCLENNLMIDSKYLHTRFQYNPETGDLIWKSIENNTEYNRSWNTKYAGKIAGIKQDYIYITLLGSKYTAHVLIWVMLYDKWPKEFIDHKDRNPYNNRKDNLREATNSQNQHNAKINSRNTSGYKGVSYRKSNDTWYARIQVRGKTYSKSGFSSAELANTYIVELRKQLVGEFGE